MKSSRHFLLLAAILLLPAVALRAQVDDSTPQPPPPGSTVITSDELHSDQVAHTSIFSGNVIVQGTNFKMNCQEMTVFFTPENKVDHMVATGDVIITQPDRITHCGHAEYSHDEDKFVLTDQPVILDHQNKITGTRITIYRTTQKMVIDGGRSTVTIGSDLSGGAKSAPLPTQ